MLYVTVHTCTFERGVSANATKTSSVVYTYVRRAVLLKKFSTYVFSEAPHLEESGTPARARRARVDAAPGIVMFSKRAAARRRRAAEPDVSVAVARAERRLEKHSARSSSSTRGASLGDAVAYAAIALGMCLMLFSRRIPVHGPEDFAPMRRAGRLAARARRTSSRTWCPAWTPGRWTTSCAPFWSRAARARDAGLPRVQPLNVHLPERGGVPRCAQRARRAARGRHRQRGRRRGHERGMARRRLAYALRRRPRGADAAARPAGGRDADALRLGLEACRPGARIGDVLEPIARRLRAEGYGVVDRYAAHGAGPAIPPAADDSARRRREKRRGVAVAAGALLHDRADGDRKRVGRNRDAPRRVDGRHRGPRLAERAVRAHRRGGRARVRDLHARRRSVTTTTRLRESVSLLYARSSG